MAKSNNYAMITYIDSKNCQKVCRLMRVSELLGALSYEPFAKCMHFPEREIHGICIDSRECREGTVFVCIRGSLCNGSRYAREALRRGARLLVAAKEERETIGEILGEFPECEGILVDDEREAAALLAARYEGEPSKTMTMIGVTGTKGKTTTVCMIRKILEDFGIRTGMIGTVGQFDGVRKEQAEHTTPDAVTLQRLLGRMRQNGCRVCVMEVSSQALKLKRTCGICFDLGVFLNLGEDHIGKLEHASREEYLACKRKLFLQSREGLGNGDDPATEQIFSGTGCPYGTFGIRQGEIRAEHIQAEGFVQGHSGVEFDVCKVHVAIPAPGRFTVYNALAAMAVCARCHVPWETASASLADFQVRGRMQFLHIPGGAEAVIDYAHNAMSLQSALETLKGYHPTRLITVFGCGGQRARERRFQMGEVSGRLSDLTILTSDNPRWEDPETIINDIETGVRKTGGAYLRIVDRREAVFRAVQMAGPGDLVVIAGKGHETTQEIQGRLYHMDEQELVEEACTQKLL